MNLSSSTFVDQDVTGLLFFFFSPVLEVNMAKLTREAIRFLQVPPHRKWLGLCSGLLGTMTVILQGLRPAELTTD